MVHLIHMRQYSVSHENKCLCKNECNYPQINEEIGQRVFVCISLT